MRHLSAAILMICCVANTIVADSLRQLSDNIRDVELGENIESKQKEARTALASIRPDGTWADIDYQNKAKSKWSPSLHLDRLNAMAAAYLTEGGSSPELRIALENAIKAFDAKALRNAAGERDSRGGNWWYYSIGIPNNLGPLLIMLDGKIDPGVSRLGVEAIGWCLRNPLDYDMAGLTGLGANSTWLIRANLYHQLLLGNEENLHRVADEFAKNFNYTYLPDEGLTEDHAFRAHYMPDVAHYYVSFLRDALFLSTGYFKDTPFQLSPDSLDRLAENILDGTLWFYYRGYLDTGVRGRNTRGPYRKEGNRFILDAVHKLSWLPGRYQPELQNADAELKAGTFAKIGNKNFHECDLMVHRGSNFYASVRGNSDRNIASESFFRAGLKTAYQADGCLWVFDDPAEFYENNIFAVLDWNRLPGITLLDGVEPFRYRSYIYGSERFVGGVSDRRNGVFAFKLGKVSVPLKANKSYFFFDDEVVCLGSSIHCTNSTADVITVIDQRPVSGDNPSGRTVITPRAFQLNRTGYYFPNSTPVTVERKLRKGKWTDLFGDAPDQNEYSAQFVTISINHGKKPHDASYAYAVLPDVDPAKVATYTKSDPFEVLVCNDRVHAVKDRSSGLTGIVFWPANERILSIDLRQLQRRSDGILLRSENNSGNKTFFVAVAGESGRVCAKPKMGMRFAVNEERLGSGDAALTVRWFDDALAPEGACWRVEYDSVDGHALSGYYKYSRTDQWKTTIVPLKNVRFSQTIRNEPGVELVIRHSDAPIDSANPKYTVTDPAPMLKNFPHTPCGPIIAELKLNLVDQSPQLDTATMGFVTTDTPCVMLLRETDNRLELSIADPTHNTTTATIILQGKRTPVQPPSDIQTTLTDTQTILSIPLSNGRSRYLVLQ